jgi:hypothetical protein
MLAGPGASLPQGVNNEASCNARFSYSRAAATAFAENYVGLPF